MTRGGARVGVGPPGHDGQRVLFAILAPGLGGPTIATTSSSQDQAASTWRCLACGGERFDPRFAVEPADAPDASVSAASFVPSSDRYGELVGAIVRCRSCRHGSLLERPAPGLIDAAYSHAEDTVSLEEEEGQVATADRDLARVERHVAPGRLLDIGCWTGSFLVAAAARGWQPEGIEPSIWASERARARGCTVHRASLDDVELERGAFRAVVACDVLEHLLDPGQAIDQIAAALEPGGVLFATVPDAGSRLARSLGRRWWAVLPMHVQYFTRRSMTALLERHGFVVEDVRTHPKVFTARYYAARLGTVVPGGRRLIPAVARRFGIAGRLVAPDLRDRMALVARLDPRRPTS